jgi:uncharacterized protein with PIN domain
MASSNPLRCQKCKEGWMAGSHWPWRRAIARFLKFTLLLLPVALLMLSKPDFYECPRCGHRKGAFWV